MVHGAVSGLAGVRDILDGGDGLPQRMDDEAVCAARRGSQEGLRDCVRWPGQIRGLGVNTLCSQHNYGDTVEGSKCAV